jgi:hypothetical protein
MRREDLVRENAIVEAARRLRPDLVRVVGAETAADLAPTLDQLLERADRGANVGDEIIDLLVADARTREELRRRLRQEDDVVRGAWQDLPGHGAPTTIMLYECNVCDFTYPVFEVGEPVPDCPRGHGALVLR